jgi:hypothetical protein
VHLHYKEQIPCWPSASLPELNSETGLKQYSIARNLVMKLGDEAGGEVFTPASDVEGDASGSRVPPTFHVWKLTGLLQLHPRHDAHYSPHAVARDHQLQILLELRLLLERPLDVRHHLLHQVLRRFPANAPELTSMSTI